MARDDRGLNDLGELRKGGLADFGVEDLPEHLSLEELAQLCESEERILRLQYRTDTHPDLAPFPESWELGLMKRLRQPTTTNGALSRRIYLGHLWHLHNEDLVQRRGNLDPDSMNVIRELLERTPVQVKLPFRTVAVTSRSYRCMMEIARHALRLKDLDQQVQRMTELEQRVAREMTLLPWTKPWARTRRKGLRRRMRWLVGLHERALIEARLHRQAIYAHAFTSSGAPAESLADVPSWWVEITPEDDAELLAGVFRAGHERIVEAAPGTEGKGGEEDEWGWMKLFSTIERSLKLPRASLWDEDLFQLEAWLLAAEQSTEEALGE